MPNSSDDRQDDLDCVSHNLKDKQAEHETQYSQLRESKERSHQ